MTTKPLSKRLAVAIASLGIATVLGTGSAAAHVHTPEDCTAVPTVSESGGGVLPRLLQNASYRPARYSSVGNCVRVRYLQAKECLARADRYRGRQRQYERELCLRQWQQARQNCYRR